VMEDSLLGFCFKMTVKGVAWVMSVRRERRTELRSLSWRLS
jgi:hypothetical protein